MPGKKKTFFNVPKLNPNSRQCDSLPIVILKWGQTARLLMPTKIQHPHDWFSPNIHTSAQCLRVEGETDSDPAAYFCNGWRRALTLHAQIQLKSSSVELNLVQIIKSLYLLILEIKFLANRKKTEKKVLWIMHELKSEIRRQIERRKGRSHRRVRYALPSRIIGTLGEDEPKCFKSNELIFTKATNNSVGHSKTTVTRWLEAVLSWILFICSIGIVFKRKERDRRVRKCICVKSWEEHVCILINIIVSTIVL